MIIISKNYIANNDSIKNLVIHFCIHQRAWRHNKTVFKSVCLTPRQVKGARVP